MTMDNSTELLGPDDPEPVAIVNSKGRSPFLLVGDHAGNLIPGRLGTLGLAAEDRTRHIAWDIGTRSLGELLAAKLDAPFIYQRYSRLVIDCNRDPMSRELIPEISDHTHIPGNDRLTGEERADRINSIHRPYQDLIGSVLAQRAEQPGTTILLSLHSFTATLADKYRPWHVGILHSDGDARFARTLLKRLQLDRDIVVGDNQPYQMDKTDYTVPRHAFASGLSYAEIEIRQDLIADAFGLRQLSKRLILALKAC